MSIAAAMESRQEEAPAVSVADEDVLAVDEAPPAPAAI